MARVAKPRWRSSSRIWVIGGVGLRWRKASRNCGKREKGRGIVFHLPSSTPTPPTPSRFSPDLTPSDNVSDAHDQCVRHAWTRRHRSHSRTRDAARGGARFVGPEPGETGSWCWDATARTSGPMFAHAAMAGLMSVGVDVIDLGIVPTPTVQMAVEATSRRRGTHADGEPQPDRMERAQVRRPRRDLPRRRGRRDGACAGRAGTAAGRLGQDSASVREDPERCSGTSTQILACR